MQTVQSVSHDGGFTIGIELEPVTETPAVADTGFTSVQLGSPFTIIDIDCWTGPNGVMMFTAQSRTMHPIIADNVELTPSMQFDEPSRFITRAPLHASVSDEDMGYYNEEDSGYDTDDTIPSLVSIQ